MTTTIVVCTSGMTDVQMYELVCSLALPIQLPKNQKSEPSADRATGEWSAVRFGLSGRLGPGSSKPVFASPSSLAPPGCERKASHRAMLSSARDDAQVRLSGPVGLASPLSLAPLLHDALVDELVQLELSPGA